MSSISTALRISNYRTADINISFKANLANQGKRIAAASNSIVHLTIRFSSQILSYGTGTIYKRDNEYFIVTAWHNATGLHTETLEHLSKSLAVPDNIVATIAIEFPGIGVLRMPITLPLFNDAHGLFYVHPENWPRIDVVAIPFDPDALFEADFSLGDGSTKKALVSLRPEAGAIKGDICPIQDYMVVRQEVADRWLATVEVTEELFIPGYPHNLQDYYAQPVWKRATIATSVQSGWNNEPKFLVDSGSKEWHVWFSRTLLQSEWNSPSSWWDI